MKIAVEIMGYIGSLLVVVSMLMTSVKKLRIVNTVGSVIFAVYALIIASYPTAFMNFCLVIINIINIVKLEQSKKKYSIIECYKDESIVQMYLKGNLEDIHKFFPEFTLEGGRVMAFLVCSGSNPVGILIGKMKDVTSLVIELDYVTAAYRDCSVGTFLYHYLSEKWDIKEFFFNEKNVGHEKYLLSMGFERTAEGFVKKSNN